MTSHLRDPQRIDFEVRCPLSGPALRIIRAFVETVARHMGFDGESVAQIEMAVDEACSNVWLHAYPDLWEQTDHPTGESARPPACQVIIRLSLNQHAMAISIIDEGIGDLEGPHQGIRSVEEYCDSDGDYHGLGTYIIRSFMDEVEFHYPEEKGTVVHMKKYLKANQEGH